MKFLKIFFVLLTSKICRQVQERKLMTNDYHDEQLALKFKGVDLRQMF